MGAPEPIHAHAIDNIRFIRDTMSRATEFTAVPGWGGVAMGVTALITAAVSGPPDDSLRWVLVWLADACVGAAIALGTMAIKARRAGTPLSSAAPAHRFALGYLPPLVAGVVLTPVFVLGGLMARLPGLLAAAVRNRGRDRRRVLRPHRADSGTLLHGARRGGVRGARGVGTLVHGRRLRRFAHWVRSGDREEIWRLEQRQRAINLKSKI